MARSSTSEENISKFRFQAFVDDLIQPTLRELRRLASSVETNAGNRFFAIGELREAMIVAAMGVASGYFPVDQFIELEGFLASSNQLREKAPAPVSELPEMFALVSFADRDDVSSSAKTVMHAFINLYASVARHTHRDDFLRKFNIELLFATHDQWDSYLHSFSSAANTCVMVGGSLPDNLLWLYEGFDAYFNFAEDIGVDPMPGLSGQAEYFSNQPPITDPGSVFSIAEEGNDPPLFPIMSWRLGGMELAGRVSERTRELQDRLMEITRLYSLTQRNWGIGLPTREYE